MQYSPTFLQQVRDGNVDRVSTTGATVDGMFKKDFKYQDHEPTKAFETEIPVFANNDELSKLLEDQNVTIEAEPVNQSRGFLASLILGFGPVILLIGLFVYFARRAGGGGMSALGNFGRSRARRAEGGQQKITFADIARIDEAKAELSEIVDFLKRPERYQSWAGGSRRACCSPAAPAPARRCSRAPSRGRPTRRSSSIFRLGVHEAIVGIGASRVRDLFKQAEGGRPGDHLHRRARRDRALAQRRHRASAAATTSASRRSTRSSPRWTASRPTCAVTSSAPRTGRRSWTPPCCGPGGSTAAWPSPPPAARAARRSSPSTRARCRWRRLGRLDRPDHAGQHAEHPPSAHDGTVPGGGGVGKRHR